jgi:ADP-ribose pyrophosphatase YjhB (NUDIX family)
MRNIIIRITGESLFLKNNIINLLYSVLRVYWRIFKPITLGVRAIVINEANEVLLVKHTYEDYWFLPGGGVKKSETFEKAIKRELIEETGYEADIIELFGVYNSTLEGKRDNIVVFICRNGNFIKSPDSLDSLDSPKSPEIETYKFFSIDNLDKLPENTSRGTRKRIEEYKNFNISNISAHFGIW